jgi:hypothetical protein
MSSIVIAGDTSGSVTLQAPAVAGSTVITLPSTSTTLVSSQWTTSGSNIYYTTGSVGVGTTAPAVSFEVNKSSGEAVRVAATGANQTIYTRYIGGSPSAANFYVGVDSAAGGITGVGAAGMMWQAGNAALAFGTNNALAMSITQSGLVLLKGGVDAVGSGVGITFPATQVASTSANCLDDYEEGTWTVVDKSGASLSLTTNASKYIKIGKMVYAFADVTFPATSSTASVNLSLPFGIDTGVQYAQMGAPIRNNKSLTCNPFTVPDAGGAIIFLKSALYTDYQTNANMTSGTCQFSITYACDA